MLVSINIKVDEIVPNSDCDLHIWNIFELDLNYDMIANNQILSFYTQVWNHWHISASSCYQSFFAVLLPEFKRFDWILKHFCSLYQQTVFVENVNISLLVTDDKSKEIMIKTQHSCEVVQTKVNFLCHCMLSVISHLNNSFFK